MSNYRIVRHGGEQYQVEIWCRRLFKWDWEPIGQWFSNLEDARKYRDRDIAYGKPKEVIE